MTKNTPKQKETSWPVEKIANIVAISVITLFAARLILMGDDPVGAWVYALVYLLVLPSFYLIISDRSKAPWLLYAVRAISVLVLLALLLLLFGVAQDVLGGGCIGIMGAHVTCFEEKQLWLIALIAVFTIPSLILGLLITIALIAGLSEELFNIISERDRSPKAEKRRWTRVIIALILLYLVSLRLPLVSPYTLYPIYAMKCGKNPITASKHAGTFSYFTPDSKLYGINPFIDDYYCSEAGARAAGYHRSNLN